MTRFRLLTFEVEIMNRAATCSVALSIYTRVRV